MHIAACLYIMMLPLCGCIKIPIPHSRFEPGFYMGTNRVLKVEISAQCTAHGTCCTGVVLVMLHDRPQRSAVLSAHPLLACCKTCGTMTWTLWPWPSGSCTRTSLAAVAVPCQPSTFIYCVIKIIQTPVLLPTSHLIHFCCKLLINPFNCSPLTAKTQNISNKTWIIILLQ
jgi:hypothetical protein